MDINCDIGESFGAYRFENDEEIVQYVTSVNIACGFHAGDPMVMQQTVRNAIKYKVKIGAHPGYPDLQGFGRRNMELSAKEIYAFVVYQIGALQAFVHVENGTLHHVKPHGALYNQSANDVVKAQAIIDAVYDCNPKLVLYCLSGSKMAKLAKAKGLVVYEEVFADRQYTDEGTLVNRSEQNASIHTQDEMLEHVKRLIEEKRVRTVSGNFIRIEAQTICIHGDGGQAVTFAKQVRSLVK